MDPFAATTKVPSGIVLSAFQRRGGSVSGFPPNWKPMAISNSVPQGRNVFRIISRWKAHSKTREIVSFLVHFVNRCDVRYLVLVVSGGQHTCTYLYVIDCCAPRIYAL